MALQKITLRLGSKTISLTPKQFEELKKDMRELDRQHHYYWHHSPWYGPWYGGNYTVRSSVAGFNCSDSRLNLIGSSAGSLSGDSVKLSNTIDIIDAEPPEFTGSILSTA